MEQLIGSFAPTGGLRRVLDLQKIFFVSRRLSDW